MSLFRIQVVLRLLLFQCITLLLCTTTVHSKPNEEDTTHLSSAPPSSSPTTAPTLINGTDHFTPPICDYYNDGCQYQVEGICDAGNACMRDTDCFDCSACAGFHLDCSACIARGCVYCPSDGICAELPLGSDFWSLLQGREDSKTSSCTLTEHWATTCPLASTVPFFAVNDPLYSAQQWAFTMINVEAVWKQGIFGQGVVIRVNDPDGVDIHHAEFEGRFVQDASCDVHQPETIHNHHGTAVASIALAAHDNQQCAMGIAPRALLSACLGPTEVRDELAAEFFLNGLPTTHISVNSWGFDACSYLPGIGYQDDDESVIVWNDDDAIVSEHEEVAAEEEETQNTNIMRQQPQRPQQPPTCPFNTTIPGNPCRKCFEWGFDSPQCEPLIIDYCKDNYAQDVKGCSEFLDLFVTCGYNTLTSKAQTALIRGITEGRNGHGIIYVFAAGNEHDLGEDLNMEGWLNTRFTIVVGAVDRQGFHAPYSTTGAALFVSGPGGDHDYLHNHMAAKPGGGCMDASVGTSYAAPTIAGAIALLLEVNPELGWRDVQGIIASTSRKVDPDHFSWTTNTAGLHHSNYYGFGIMDALAAVEAAKTWTNFGPERQLVVESGTINVQIADDVSQPATSTVTIDSVNGQFSTESVVVYLQLDHASRGDLEIVLTSPGGTHSRLHPSHRPENQHLDAEERWKLLSVVFYGEPPQGAWTLTITDASSGNLRDCIDHDFEAYYLYEEDDHGYGAIDCGSIAAAEFCSDGSVLISTVDTLVDLVSGQSGRDACCACGGGKPPTTASALDSWRMVVYGHGDEQLQQQQEESTVVVEGPPPDGDLGSDPERSNADMQNVDGDHESSTLFEASGDARSSVANDAKKPTWVEAMVQLIVVIAALTIGGLE